MMERLLSCPGCARHVRVNETRCPFCRIGLSHGSGAEPASVAPRALSRPEILRLATRAAAGLAGCSLAIAGSLAAVDCSSGPSKTLDAGYDTDVMGIAAYGSPCFDAPNYQNPCDPGLDGEVDEADAPSEAGEVSAPVDAPHDSPIDVSSPSDALDGTLSPKG